jgi:predicted Holliday junction resolvase-like endonuclease
VVFDGYKNGDSTGITFLDVKTGRNTALSPIEGKLKQLIEKGKVRWETIQLESLEEE